VGFDPETAQDGGGLGLRSIAERAQQIGANLRLESASGQGTKLQIDVNTQAQATVTQAAHHLRPDLQ
jgi:signal transduction histidine kinase